MGEHLCAYVLMPWEGYLLSQMCQRAGGGEKGTCVQVLNLPKTGYLTWRQSKKSTSTNWSGRDHPFSRMRLCWQGPWALGNKRLTLSLCTPLPLVGDWPCLHRGQYQLSGKIGWQGKHDLFNTQQGIKGNSPSWSQATKRQEQDRVCRDTCVVGLTRLQWGWWNRTDAAEKMNARKRQEKTNG